MEPLQALLRMHESDDPPMAFRAVADALAETIPLRCALRVSLSDRSVSDTWPQAAEISTELIDTVAGVMRPEVFKLGSDLPLDAVRYPNTEMLLLPLRRHERHAATAILIADNGAFGQDLEPWDQLARALERFEERYRRMSKAEEECEQLRRRVEENEALHTLGLAANRTLNPEEVLSLVARFTRTLLGAHYVTVNTATDGKVETVASIGLRTAHITEDYLFARRVVEAEKPLTVNGPEANFRAEDFPFHSAEGMRVGLGIPLALFGETFGALIVGYREEYPLTPRDTRLALTLAEHAAVAIGNARLHAAVEDRSKELERAYDELRRVSLAKESFFASINHELRT
ncbi:MAG TPA: GAF domain-containing protein, partial [Longimicrobiaceae bacterium]|nr:GAF domain-containing protein [Longimicrobiaceae bacterium]